MRIAVAELAQETDSFSPVLAGLADFETYGLFYGEDVIQRMQGAGPIGGFLDVVAERTDNVELVPLLRGWASAGGPICDETFSQLRGELLDRLRAAGKLDAVFLSLHGAASSVSEDDVEGAVLEDVRRVVGNSVPIAVPLDHHASVTRRMVQNADLLVGHETQPHDPPATGRKTARLMFQMLAGEISPVMAWQRIPLITPQDQFLTSGGPMKEWFDLARELENRPGVLDVSPYPMQPWLDVAEGGWAVVVHTDGDPELAREVAAEISARAWDLREEFWKSGRVPVAEAVRSAVAADDGLVILSDTGDSVYGGAPGDNTTLLRELLEQQVPCLSLVPVVDAAAVAVAFDAGVPSTVTLNIGGQLDSIFSSPVEVTGRVVSLSENVTTDIPGRGVCNLGRTALIECGAVRIVLLDHRSFGVNHPLLYAHLGIDVAAAKLVVVKPASNFQFFSQWRKQMIRVDTPGTTQSNLSEFNWQRLPRPIFPFDELPSWSPEPEVVV